MDSNFTDLLGDHRSPLDLSIFEQSSSSNSDSCKEILEQQLYLLLDRCFWELPQISSESITKSVQELSRFLSLNKYLDDPIFADLIKQSLRQSIRSYDYKDSLFKALQKHWHFITDDIEHERPSDLHPRLEELIRQYYSILAKLLLALNEAFLNSIIASAVFPAVSSFESLLKDILQELKTQTTRKKIQLKLCPGVEPPQIKRVQRQSIRIIKKPYTEWNTFVANEIVEIEQEPSCVMVPLLHRLMNYTNQSKTQVVSYFAPTGWEVTRISACIAEGNYKAAVIKRSACKGNKGLVEVEVTYPRITREHVWCKVSIEGVLSRKSTQEIKVPEYKTVIVTVDEDGEHDLPEEFLEEID